MAQQFINYGNPPDGSGGDNRRAALEKLEANDAELYAAVAAIVPYGGFRNLLINGDGRLNQRVFAGGALAANKYGYDRWRTLGAASSMTVGTSTISLNGTICQVIEAPDLANATVTISVGNSSGAITVSLQPDATTVTTAAGTIPAGAGIRTLTLSVPATLTGNVYLLLTSAGPVTIDGPAKRAGIQIELGSNASPFERKPIGQEFFLCQRYYEKSYSLGVAPGTASATAGASAIAIGGLSSGTNLGEQAVVFAVRKRSSPTMVAYSPVTGATGKARDNNSGVDVTVTIGSQGDGGFNWFCSSSAASTGINFQMQWAADSEL